MRGEEGVRCARRRVLAMRRLLAIKAEPVTCRVVLGTGRARLSWALEWAAGASNAQHTAAQHTAPGTQQPVPSSQ